MHFLKKHAVRIARVGTVLLFLALIRTLVEPLRDPGAPVRALLVGALVAACACLVITLMDYYGRHLLIAGVVLLTLITLIIIKCTMI